jgi:GNAT superfamily N-acetyltransferase
MADVAPPRPLSETDDVSRFDCGQDSMNEWLRRHALNNHLSGLSRVTVLTARSSSEIVAYVTLSSAQIERAFLRKTLQRNRPAAIPATLLGQLAVHKDHQGQGHARSLLYFALRTALAASYEIASFGVITHPINDGVRGFYRRWGFEELPFDPQRAMIVRMTELVRNGIGGD